MRTVFEGIVDYAGLFPPASLGMADALQQYQQHRHSADRGMLARFVVAASRLEELGQELISHEIATNSAEPWRISAVLGNVLPQEMDRIAAFRSSWDSRGVLVDAVELRVTSPGQIQVVGETITSEYLRFLEVPAVGPYTALVHAIGEIGAYGKIRTGGTTPELFPAPEELTQFLIASVTQRIPFKATAGLHHPFRGSYPLTYATDSDRYLMYGFVNVLLATAELSRGGDGEQAQEILEEADPSLFEVTPDAISWRTNRYPTDELVEVRRRFFLGFGSCSFREPVDELRAVAVA